MTNRYRELADAYRTGSRTLTPAELAELDAFDAVAETTGAEANAALYDLPIFGWAWKGDAADLER